MEGTRPSVTGGDGVRIGLLTSGSGPALLLVHGGMGTMSSWQRMWPALGGYRRVTAMDRRGRGSSGDADAYALSSEYADVAAVATALASEQGGPVDVVGHSIGATCVLGAAAGGAPFRRVVLYEPPGPQATPDNWPERVSAMVDAGTASPPWAGQITRALAAALPAATVAELAGAGHDALDSAPDLFAARVLTFLSDSPGAGDGPGLSRDELVVPGQ
jgi:pimeloyl-ACP methyl ester carboxylesterase